MPRKKSPAAEPRVAGVVGLGLDCTDGHRRITEAEDFLIVGGSEETHERMQETAIRFGELLEKRGKRLQDASLPEVIDLLQKARDH